MTKNKRIYSKQTNVRNTFNREKHEDEEQLIYDNHVSEVVHNSKENDKDNEDM